MVALPDIEIRLQHAAFLPIGYLLRIYRCLAIAAFVAINLCPHQADAAEPDAIRIILVGDSTMATRTGYGDALCGLFRPNITCINLAKGGRSTASYRAEGSWEQVMNLLRTKKHFLATYVLIQFGHNDQPGKPGRSTDLSTEFPANMARYADDVKSLDAVPLLLTPLTRRQFRDGALQNDLAPWADATRRVAAAKSLLLLDLNAESATAISAMGAIQANTLAMAAPPKLLIQPPTSLADAGLNHAKVETVEPVKHQDSPRSTFDHTHLGATGALFFAQMVARELGNVVPALEQHTKLTATLR